MEPDHVAVSVDQLRQACTVLLDEVERRFGSDVALCPITFEEDHYWTLGLHAAFGLVDRPDLRVAAGQTSDDAEEVRGMLERESGEVFLSHDLEHLAAVLRRLAFLASRS